MTPNIWEENQKNHFLKNTNSSILEGNIGFPCQSLSIYINCEVGINLVSENYYALLFLERQHSLLFYVQETKMFLLEHFILIEQIGPSTLEISEVISILFLPTNQPAQVLDLPRFCCPLIFISCGKQTHSQLILT